MIFTCTVAGTPYTLTDNWNIPQQGGAVSTASIDIKVPVGIAPPSPYSLVIIYADAVPFFRGYLSSLSSPDYSSGWEVRIYRLSVNSAESVFNNRLVSESLADMTTTEIIQYLFDNYISAENIDLGSIATIDYTYDTYACQYQKLYDVLSEIATDNDATFYVSPDNKFYFLTRNDFTQIDAPTHITALNIENESGDLRTVQIVSGATEDTTSTTEHVYWTDGQGSFTVGYDVKSITGITVAGITVGVGILGVDEADTTKTFLYSVGSNTITLNASATSQPSAGQLVVIVYVGLYDIDVTETNESLKSTIATLSGTSGIIETQYTDETLDSYSTADAKALALLAAYNDYEQTVSCVWRGDTLSGSALFTMWLFAYPELNISGQYVITERTIASFGANRISISIKLKNKNYFQRYGTVLVRVTKQATTDIKVYKNTSIAEKVTTLDEYKVDSGDIVYYPTSGAYHDPMLGAIYPGY